MVSYSVEFTGEAEADLDRLDAQVMQRVLKKMRWMADNYESIAPETLTGQWQGAYKLRVGDYRVIYTCDESRKGIIIRFVKHRREVYKNP